MAAVSLKNDPRVARLGRLAGWSTFEAIGRLVTLRERCVELGTDAPGDVEIEAVLDSSATQLVRAGLGELTGNGGIRVLDVPSRRGAAGGRARAQMPRGDRGRLAPRETSLAGGSLDDAGDLQVNAGGSQAAASGPQVFETCELPAIASRASDLPPDLHSSLGSGLPDASSPLTRKPQTRASAVTPLSPAQRVVQLLTNDAWEIAQREHARLRPLIDPTAQPWTALAAGAGKTEMLARIAQLLEIESAGGEPARDAIRRRVAVATAEAERDRSLRWFVPTQIWGDKQFWRSAEITPEQAAQPRGAAAIVKPTRDELDGCRRVLEKLTAQNGVPYGGAHIPLLVGHFRRGVAEMDLRAIVAYCATELGWRDDAKMRVHLEPETLFGEGKIAKYLEPARAWLAKLPDEHQPEADA